MIMIRGSAVLHAPRNFISTYKKNNHCYIFDPVKFATIKIHQLYSKCIEELTFYPLKAY